MFVDLCVKVLVLGLLSCVNMFAVSKFSGGSLDLYSAQSYQKENSLNGNVGEINCFQFSKDSSLLAIGGNSGLEVWDTTVNPATLKITLDHSEVSYCGFGNHTNNVVSRSVNRYAKARYIVSEIKVWAADTGDLLFSFGRQAVDEVLFCLGDEYIAVCLSGNPGILNLKSMKDENDITLEHPFSFRALAVSPDGFRAATAASKNVVLWGLVDRNIELVLSGHTDDVKYVQFNGTGTQLVSCSDEDLTVIIWDCISGVAVGVIDEEVWYANFTSCGTAIACGLVDGAAIIDIETRRRLFELEGASQILCAKPMVVLM